MIVTCFWFMCWRQMKTGYVALALCLNIGVDPPDVIKISPCARMECWIGNTLSQLHPAFQVLYFGDGRTKRFMWFFRSSLYNIFESTRCDWEESASTVRAVAT